MEITHSLLVTVLITLLIVINTSACSQKKDPSMTYHKLTSEEERVIIHKGTEIPYSGKYYKHKEPCTYHCRRCDAALYKSSDKFDAGCGWPSFDDEIEGAVKRLPDADGKRTEIICAACGAHLGHVFEGEGFTPKDTRHCVNSVSLSFKSDAVTDTAYFAGGCFWGVEYYFSKQKGVLSVTSGYMSGHTDNPTYKQVCTGKTGHAETVRVVYDTLQLSYEQLARLFFEIHDFEQLNRQGPDIGTQYRSAVFYNNDLQRECIQKLLGILNSKGYKVATTAEKASTFWEAEAYHQNYYESKGGRPYCHSYRKVF